MQDHLKSKTIFLDEILALHKSEQSKVMPEYFMDNHCNKIIESGEHDEVIVIHEGKEFRTYRKSNLKVVWRADENNPT